MRSTSGEPELGGARGRLRRPRAAIQANEAFMGCSMFDKKEERHSPKTRQNHVPGPFHETLKEYEAHRPTTALVEGFFGFSQAQRIGFTQNT